MRKPKEFAGKTDLSNLEFPDWSGMDDLSPRLTPDEAFRLCEQHHKWFPEIAQKTLERYPKCAVEFVL